jgi:hypothetical protein
VEAVFRDHVHGVRRLKCYIGIICALADPLFIYS